MKCLLPGLNARRMDIQVHPQCHARNTPPHLPVAYEITVSSGRADDNTAEKWKKGDLATKVATIAGEALLGLSRLGWNFVPLAFDSLGSPSVTTITSLTASKVMGRYAAAVASRSGWLTGVKTHLYQKLSYAI